MQVLAHFAQSGTERREKRVTSGQIERLEGRFSGAAYAPHRHDTYAIGVTLGGVQSFDYRGSTRHCLPGQVFVLHPDELHDGRAGTEDGFHYKTLYVPPAALQSALGNEPLPFVDGGICDHAALRGAVLPLLDDAGETWHDDAIYDLAMALRLAAGRGPQDARLNASAVRKAQELIHEHLHEGVSLDDLALHADQDKWQLSRDFRAILGTSPHRYLVQRRLEQAKVMLLEGKSAAGAAAACGFSDQSHFGRHFKAAFGLSPRSWLNLHAC